MPEHPADRPAGAKLAGAVAWASELHADQTRRGTDDPYLGHLLAVAALVLEDGGDEQEAVAALLHDAVEHQGGRPVLEQIERRFGAEVAELVALCSDSTDEGRTPWSVRKAAHLAALEEHSVPSGAVRIMVADKLDNGRAILAAARRDGFEAWNRCPALPSEWLDYYRAVVDFADRRLPRSRNLARLKTVIAALERVRPTVPDSAAAL